MDGLVILSRQEGEYLVHALESCLAVHEPRHLFIWSQAQLQALLPHRALVCMALDPSGAPVRIALLESGVPEPALADALCDPVAGVARALLVHWQAGGGQPLALDAYDAPELGAHGLANVLAHGTGALPGGGSFVLLFDLAQRPGARQAHFLRLLMPHLHLALQRLALAAAPPPRRALSLRERQVLQCLGDGLSNGQIAARLGISAPTVKNHLHRLYRVLGVGNRAHAVARSQSLPGSIGYWSA